MNLASILRHWFTLLATLLTGWLVLPPEQQAELTEALGDLVGPLVIILTLVVTAAWRMALAWASNIFSGRDSGDEKAAGGPSGGVGLLILGCTVAGLCAMPSCSSFSAPLGIAVEGKGYTASYSPEGVEVKAEMLKR